MRLGWARNFLERGGMQFIMSQIYALDVNNADTKQTEFMLALVRVFLTAAFACDQSKEFVQAVRLTRKSSSIDDGDALDRQTKKKDDNMDKLH